MRFPMMYAAIAASTMVVVAPAQAAEVRPFDTRAFALAQKQGRPILIDIYADWCPTCKAQAPVIERIVKSPWATKMVVFRLNFDTQKSDWQKLGVRRQSTLIAYRGLRETGRSVGDTDPARIEKLIRSPVA
ncbi:thioredoxin family protein [Sphingomonas sp. TREG-RG-20F-R18-01]|uniref:thioredoxin family protein n=1 Tax=Sphingomonas sp. TREG-RG-20F-R18-01 TaxID=2914982 RepID=UPI001F57B612|nr:thioredoxin family protein [Sphingomonas sp. TREG-RG-20F-R18-01]